MLLSEDEVKIKSQLWFAENADFLKELEGINKDIHLFNLKDTNNFILSTI